MSVWKLKKRPKSSSPPELTEEPSTIDVIQENVECLKKRKAELDVSIMEDCQKEKVTREKIMGRLKFLWQEGDPDELINSIGVIKLSRYDFGTIKEKELMSDKVVDAYMELIVKRGKQHLHLPTVYVFNSYFYSALDTQGYSRVSRWTANTDIFSYDILLFPIHSSGHRSLVAFDQEKNCFAYLDSMFYSDTEVTRSVAICYARDISDYLEQESAKKGKGSYDKSNATIVSFEDIPTQANEADCGVFLCTYAENITRQNFRTFSFKQADVRYLRRKICFELGEGRILE